MQIKYSVRISMLFLGVSLLSFVPPPKFYQTECISMDTDGYVTLKIWDTKKGAKYRVEQAQKDAIHAIVYSGISGTSACSTQPPLLKNTEEQNNFKAIEKSFFAKSGKWVHFTRSSETETALPLSLGEKNWNVYRVAVSKNQLRKFLEEQKIIKPINNGF